MIQIRAAGKARHFFPVQGASVRKLLQRILVVAIGTVLISGGRWSLYVAYADSLYQEVGLALNGQAPAPVRRRGCRTLQSRSVGQSPPHGCAAADGRRWI